MSIYLRHEQNIKDLIKLGVDLETSDEYYNSLNVESLVDILEIVISFIEGAEDL